jgi:predicted MPP superfamily phosphohydrolase
MKKGRKRLIALGLLLPVVILGVWALVIEPSRLTVERAEIRLKGWPPQLNGLKIVLLSDLHIGAPHYRAGKLPKIVELINEQQPDLVLFAGDFVVGDEVGASFVPPETIAAGLREVKARLGVFAVLGNHDWWEGGPRVSRALTAGGLQVLENQAVELKRDGTSFWLAGLGDNYTGHTNVSRAMAEVRAEGPVLAFTHSPDIFPELPDRIVLAMAGHTHGGQVWLPFLGRKVVPSAFGQRYASGHIREGAKQFFVTDGVGTSVFPVRFMVPPEISVLTLTAE